MCVLFGSQVMAMRYLPEENEPEKPSWQTDLRQRKGESQGRRCFLGSYLCRWPLGNRVDRRWPSLSPSALRGSGVISEESCRSRGGPAMSVQSRQEEMDMVCVMAQKASHWPLSLSPWPRCCCAFPGPPPLPACPNIFASPIAGKETLVTAQLRRDPRSLPRRQPSLNSRLHLVRSR
jgi:hypothetical protein